MKIRLLCTALLAMSFANTFAQSGKSTWGKTDYEDAPWVKNVSRPNEITEDYRIDIFLYGHRMEDITMLRKVDGDGKDQFYSVLLRTYTHKQ